MNRISLTALIVLFFAIACGDEEPTNNGADAGVSGSVCVGGQQDNDGDGLCTAACTVDSCGAGKVCNDDSGTVVCTCEPGTRCECDEGYVGETCASCAVGYQDYDGDGVCEPDCSRAELDCSDNEECEDASGQAQCVCSSGFQRSAVSGACEVGCGVDTCSGHGICDDESGVVQCLCSGGYEGLYCDSCASGMQDNNGDGVCETSCVVAGPRCAAGVDPTTFTEMTASSICLDICQSDGLVFGGSFSASTEQVSLAGCTVGSSVVCGCEIPRSVPGRYCAYVNAGPSFTDAQVSQECSATCFSQGLEWAGTWTENGPVLESAGCMGDSPIVCDCSNVAGVCSGTNRVCDDTSGPAQCVCGAGTQDNDFDFNCTVDCANSHLNCGSNSFCSDSDGTAACHCSVGFQDNDNDGICSFDCTSVTLSCQSNASCNDQSGSVLCACDTGYQDNDANTSCYEDCTSLTCGLNTSCADASGTALCSCNTGFSDPDNDGDCTEILPDLVVTGGSCEFSAVEQGVGFICTFDLENRGQLLATPHIGVYLSTDATISASDTRVSLYPTYTTFNPGATRSLRVLGTVPNSQAVGDYYVGAIVDPEQAIDEMDEGNNAGGTSGTVSVIAAGTGGPDLIVESVNHSPTTATGGRGGGVPRIRNVGSTDATPSLVEWRLSVDAVFSTQDVFIGTCQVLVLRPGESAIPNCPGTVPLTTLPGAYYWVVKADSTELITEVQEDNNTGASAVTIY